jgi:hypothetical protein
LVLKCIPIEKAAKLNTNNRLQICIFAASSFLLKIISKKALIITNILRVIHYLSIKQHTDHGKKKGIFLTGLRFAITLPFIQYYDAGLKPGVIIFESINDSGR